MFNSDKYHRIGRTSPSLLEQVLSDYKVSIHNECKVS